jgi:hypothetical protein
METSDTVDPQQLNANGRFRALMNTAGARPLTFVSPLPSATSGAPIRRIVADDSGVGNQD